MSHNQSRSEKSEGQLRKPGRSGSSGQQRSFQGGGGKGGGGTVPPPSSSTRSSSSLQPNRSFKKSGNHVQGQSWVSTSIVNSESKVAATRPAQNAAHVQPPLHGVSDAPVSGVASKPNESSTPRSTRAVPRAPPSQSATGGSVSVAPTTPAKGEVSSAFPLQFGTISPGFVNGMQIPARTSSAPPNLDEQKHNQVHHENFKAVPTMPIPSAPKQQQPRKDVSTVKQLNAGETHPPVQVKRDMHAQVPSAPAATTMHRTSGIPITGMSMPMSFQQPLSPAQFGGPNPQIHSQVVTATSLQMPMQLAVSNATQVQQQMFVPSLQSHPLQPPGMMHQGQSMSFPTQMGHQLAPQLGNLAIGITPQFAQQQGGAFGGPRKAVKITDPKTREELKLDKTELYLDGSSSGHRSHPNMPPQSQAIPSFTPPHQINYYPPIQQNSYNPNSIYFSSQTSLPLTSTPMIPGSLASRYNNYPVCQPPQTVSLMYPPPLNPLSKIGTPTHGVSEPSNSEYAQNAYPVASSAPLASVQVTVKPAAGLLGEEVGSSSVSVSSPVVGHGESPEFLRPLGEANSYHPQRDCDIGAESSVQQSKSIPEPLGSISLSDTVKHSAPAFASSVQRTAPSTSSSPAVPPEESTSTLTNIEGRRRETIRRSDSVKDHQKKLNKKDIRISQPQHQEVASDSAGTLKSTSGKTSVEVARRPEVMQIPPSEAGGSSTSISSISSLPSWSFERGSSFKDGIHVEGKATPAPSETSGVLESVQEPVHGILAGSHDAFEAVPGSVRIGEGFTCEPSNTPGFGPVSDNFSPAYLRKQDGCSVSELGKTELPEGPKQGVSTIETFAGSTLESLEGSTQTEHKDSHVEVTAVDNESGSVKTEQESNEKAQGCVLMVGRTTDSLIRAAASSLESTDSEASPSDLASSTVFSENKSSTMDASTSGSECINSQEDAINESVMSHQELGPVQTPVSSEVTWRVEGKSAGNTSGGPVSTLVSASKDKLTLEPNRTKNTTAKGKKKRKEILKIADAAGTTSDLYMAYKGPEEKQEAAVSSENLDSTSSVDVKQTSAYDTEKDVVAIEEDGQSKAEPDDWEDVAAISAPKLKTSDSGKLVDDGLMIHHDVDGNEVTCKKYSRDFLLTLSEQYTDLPTGFEIGPDIVVALMRDPGVISHGVDHESYPNSGRLTGGLRPDRRGSGMVDDDKWNKSPGPFTLGQDLRLEIGHGGRYPRVQASPQYVGGILPGPMQSLASHGGMQRNGSDGDWWQRSAGMQKGYLQHGLIPSPQTPLRVMHKAERKYEIRKVSDEEERKQRQLKAILNKLTPQNFDKLFEQVKDVNIDNTVTLTGVISQIFDKALTEPTFCEMYANFCSHLASELPDFSEDNEKITFKRLLLNKCQEEFERGEREQAEADRVEEEGEVKRSEEEREEKKVQARRRMLGNIRLIGELYKKKMLTERIMHECIKKLLGHDSKYLKPDEENVEALCKLMSTIGEMIDHPKAKEHMDAYFEIMKNLSNNTELSSRVRFMLRDSLDLRKDKWKQRRKVEGPKKIEEVHRDAAQERQAQTSRLARGPGSSSSARRGQPTDFGPRGTTMLSSSNAQMSGFRGLPSQVRGLGAQDVRSEDRHPYERMLSIPLPQRPINDDSITLGPQGGLARGMSIKGQPLMSNSPLVDSSPSPGDSRRMAAGSNGYNSVSDWTPYNSREEHMSRYSPERFVGPPAHDQSNSLERNTYIRKRDIRNADSSFDRSLASSPATRVQGSSVAENVSEKVWSEEHLREMSIAAIREFYSAKDEKEVSLCIKDLNSPGFHPSMISIWVTDSFERKDMDRDLLAKLLVNLTKSRDSLLDKIQLTKGFESVLATLEEAVTDAPKAAVFFGRILAKVIVENVVPLKEIGRLIREGGDEPGRLLQIGLAFEVISNILESIRLEKGDSVLTEIRTSSNLLLEDFQPPDPIGARKLDAFI